MPVALDMSVSIGSSGAPTIESGSGLGISSITRLAAGQYRIQLKDNYMKLLMVNSRMQSPAGTPVAIGSLAPNSVYQITAMGTSTQANWVSAGLPVGITAAVGVTFKCAATSSGTGTAALLSSSGISSVEVMGNNVNMLNNQPYQSPLGGYVDIQTMGTLIAMGAYTPSGTVAAGVIAVTAGTAGDAVTNNAGVLNSTGGQDLAVNAQAFTGAVASLTGTASMAAADPASGSKLWLQLLLSNSSMQ